MLLIDFENNKIDDKCEKNEKVKKSYLIVKRDKREKIFNFFDFEIIFVHDIEFFDVTNDVIVVINEVINASKTNDFIEIVENEKNEIDC